MRESTTVRYGHASKRTPVHMSLLLLPPPQSAPPIPAPHHRPLPSMTNATCRGTPRSPSSSPAPSSSFSLAATVAAAATLRSSTMPPLPLSLPPRRNLFRLLPFVKKRSVAAMPRESLPGPLERSSRSGRGRGGGCKDDYSLMNSRCVAIVHLKESSTLAVLET